jgi:hypothetical protein
VPDRPGRHRAPGHGRYVALRRAPARHRADDRTIEIPRITGRRLPLRVGLLTAIAGLALTDVMLGALPLRHDQQSAPVAGGPLPAFTIPVPPTAAAPSTRAARGAQRQRAKARPPVLLGPRDLAASIAAYCTRHVSGATGAKPADDGWQCERPLVRPVAVDMDAACRWRYGPDAWAGMLDDNDQQSWRCYRDPP